MASSGSGGGAILSHYNPQQQFPLDLDLLRMLFPHRYGGQLMGGLPHSHSDDYTSAAQHHNRAGLMVSGGTLHRSGHAQTSAGPVILSSREGGISLKEAGMILSDRSSQRQNLDFNRAVGSGQHKFQSLRAVVA